MLPRDALSIAREGDLGDCDLNTAESKDDDEAQERRQ